MFLTMSSLQSLLEKVDQEQRFKNVLEQSIKDLENTVCQLEQRVDNPSESEWQLRYHTQVNLNHHLDQQQDWLRRQVEGLQDRPFFGIAEFDLDSFSEAQLARCLRQLEKDRDNLKSDVRDLEWRLDQESKAFHKFDEARKAYRTELKDAMTNLEALRSQVKIISKDYIMFSKRKGNILPNHRVLDPKRGPIKKTAAVRSLPRLNGGNQERTSGHISE